MVEVSKKEVITIGSPVGQAIISGGELELSLGIMEIESKEFLQKKWQTNPDEFVDFAVAIMDALKAQQPAPVKPPRRDKGTHRAKITNLSANVQEQVNDNAIITWKGKYTSKVGLNREPHCLSWEDKEGHGATLQEAADNLFLALGNQWPADMAATIQYELNCYRKGTK